MGEARRNTPRPRVSRKCTESRVVGSQQETQITFELVCSPSEGEHVFGDVLGERHVGLECLECGDEHAAVLAHSGKIPGSDTDARLGTAARQRLEAQHVESGEESSRVLANPPRVVRDLIASLGVGHESRAKRLLDVAHQIIDAVTADRQAEVLGRDVLELVRLVDDGVAAPRDHFAEVALPDRGVSAEQMVIDDHDIGFGRALPHLDDEAVVVARTLGANAVLTGCRDLVPEGKVLRKILDLGAIASLGVRQPALEYAEMTRLVP